MHFRFSLSGLRCLHLEKYLQDIIDSLGEFYVNGLREDRTHSHGKVLP